MHIRAIYTTAVVSAVASGNHFIAMKVSTLTISEKTGHTWWLNIVRVSVRQTYILTPRGSKLNISPIISKLIAGLESKLWIVGIFIDARGNPKYSPFASLDKRSFPNRYLLENALGKFSKRMNENDAQKIENLDLGPKYMDNFLSLYLYQHM